MQHYYVVVTLFGPSAKNAGIIGTSQKTRARWTNDVPSKLVYDIVNDGTQQVYQLQAPNDGEAFNLLTLAFNERNTGNHKPISGKSYIRHCRQEKE